MEKCHLIVDSCCDLSARHINHPGITLLKFPYIIDGKAYEDDLFQSITSREFYDGMRNGAEPTTSQLSLPVLLETFTEAAKKGTPTVYLSFTSGLSGSYDVACLVRDQVLADYPDFELYIVDTKLPSLAEGLLVLEAINQWNSGMSAADIAKWAEDAIDYVACEFMVEDLDTLKRGGRIPASAAVAGAALNVKPMLSVDAEGKLELVGVARGRKKGIAQLATFVEKNLADNPKGSTVLVGHADCPEDAEQLIELVKEKITARGLDKELNVDECLIGPVIGSHVGPGMIAVGCWSNGRASGISFVDKITSKIKG